MVAFDYVIVAVFLGPVVVQGARDLWARARSVVTGEADDLERRKQAILAEADRLARVREAARALVRAMRLEGSYRADAVPVALAQLEEALGERAAEKPSAGTGEIFLTPAATANPNPMNTTDVHVTYRVVTERVETMERSQKDLQRRLDEQMNQLDQVREKLFERFDEEMNEIESLREEAVNGLLDRVVRRHGGERR